MRREEIWSGVEEGDVVLMGLVIGSWFGAGDAARTGCLPGLALLASRLLSRNHGRSIRQIAENLEMQRLPSVSGMSQNPAEDKMADRLNLDELRPELRAPEIRPFLLAYLALVGGRVSRVARYRERGVSAMTLLDLILNQHILAFEIIEGGTRQSSIVDSLEAPRRTVRDGLDPARGGRPDRPGQ